MQNDAPLVDQFGRVKRKLRLSVTDRCNYRCIYCMPEEPVWKPREEVLTLEEMARLASIFVRRLGIRRIRLTGGEPTLRSGLATLIEMLQPLRADGLERVSLTSNGVRLGHMAPSLKSAGLDDVNVSMDAVDADRFRSITGGGDLRQVMDGIEASRHAGLKVKVNAVAIRDMNEDQILPLMQWAFEHEIVLRFIEFMPLDGRGLWQPKLTITESDILAEGRKAFDIRLSAGDPSDPARGYLLNGKPLLGIISTISNPFCDQCDRVRITSDGVLLPCLFSPGGPNLRDAMRDGASDEEIIEIARVAIYAKWEGFVALNSRSSLKPLPMHVMGG